jgi:hypothetical protein
MLGPWMLQHQARARVLSDPFWGSGQGAFKASATLTPSHQKAPNDWKRQVGLTLHGSNPWYATRMPHGVVDPWLLHFKTGPPRNGAFDHFRTFLRVGALLERQ